jgi:hypothetical protein
MLCLAAVVACKQQRYYVPAKKVEVRVLNNRYQLYKNGQPFTVKGAMGNSHLEQLAVAGGNTVMCWDTASLPRVFAQAQQFGLSVIVGLDVAGGNFESYWENDSLVNVTCYDYRRLVNQYKNHPSLLAWCLGNEMIMPFSLTEKAFHKGYNRMLDIILETDGEHPVSTTIMNYERTAIFCIRYHFSRLNFISINTYSRLRDIDEQLRRVSLLWDGPFLISEWSGRGGWEVPETIWTAPLEYPTTKKAKEVDSFYRNFMPLRNNRFLGSVYFYWGYRQEYTPTFYSSHTYDSHPTDVVEVLSNLWKTELKQQRVSVQYALIDSRGGQENILLTSGSSHTASVLLATGQQADSLKYKWVVMEESWHTWGQTWNNFVPPDVVPGLMADSSLPETKFTSPQKEGPYRLYGFVYNQHGYAAIANVPFYVVKSDL